MKTAPISPEEREEIILELTSVMVRIDLVHERLFAATSEGGALARRSLLNNRASAHAALTGFEAYLMGLTANTPIKITAPGKLSTFINPNRKQHPKT